MRGVGVCCFDVGVSLRAIRFSFTILILLSKVNQKVCYAKVYFIQAAAKGVWSDILPDEEAIERR